MHPTPSITIADRRLAMRLGVGDLFAIPCHGYHNACMCFRCDRREKNPLDAPEQPRQPWELSNAA